VKVKGNKKIQIRWISDVFLSIMYACREINELISFMKELFISETHNRMRNKLTLGFKNRIIDHCWRVID
jgi:hypothetical protein